tara:strand:+ start:5950 stop:7809 length:1860 start_codon:yes stop_codon:yes gene_type:complete
MVKKKVNRSVERSRDKKAPNITQTTSVNIKIVPEALKPKKKKKRKGTSKKKKVIEQIKQALNELAQLKEEAKEKGVTIPAELGELPTDADDLKTLEQLQGLLAELKNKNAKINDIVRGQGQSGAAADQIGRTRQNIFQEAQGQVFGGGTFPAQYRLPNTGLVPTFTPALTLPSGQVTTTRAQQGQPALPAPPVRPAIMPPDPDSRVVKPQSKTTRDQELIMKQIADIKKDLQERLKKQLKDGKITKKEFTDKMSQAQQQATVKERSTLRAVMGPEANKDYIEIMSNVTAYRTKVRGFKGTTITGKEADDIKDLGNEGLTKIMRFKQKYPELVAAHPELFEFNSTIEFLNADPVAVVAQEQGVTVKETGILKATEDELKQRIEDLNQNTQQLQEDFDRFKTRQKSTGETISPAEAKQLKQQATKLKQAEKAIDDIIRKQGPISGDVRLLTEPENLKQKITTMANEIEKIQVTVVPVQKNMKIQNAIYRLLAFTSQAIPDMKIGSQYQKETMKADMRLINGGGMADNSVFNSYANNSGDQTREVANVVNQFLNTADPDMKYDRQFEGKNYQIGKGGMPSGGGSGRRSMRRMMPPPQATFHDNLGFGASIGGGLAEVPEMAF